MTRFFLSWVRTGVIAGVTDPDPGGGILQVPAVLHPKVGLARDDHPIGDPVTGPEVRVLGPGAVASVDPGVFARPHPPPDAVDALENEVAYVELTRPDLPWLFTPAGPSAGDRLRPWLVLAVVPADAAEVRPGSPNPVLRTSSTELPPLGSSWALAHVQATTDQPAAIGELVADHDPAVCARLLSTRRLAADARYLACVVPAFMGGRLAGLGGDPDGVTDLDPAWDPAVPIDVDLPVYDWWSFTTGPAGDFESLVTRLQRLAPGEATGFGGRPVALDEPRVVLRLDGALRVPGPPPPPAWDEATRAAFVARLRRRLNFPASANPAEAEHDRELSVVAPPIYGNRHAGVETLPTADGWLPELNLDPMRRVAAGFGAAYVRQDQETLMAQAWEQVGAIREANRLRRVAELAAAAARRAHERHVQPLTPGELVALTAPAAKRLKVQADRTLAAAVAASTTADATTTVAWRRLTRPGGPLARRFAAVSGDSAPFADVVAKVLHGEVEVVPSQSQLDGLDLMHAPPAEVPDAGSQAALAAWQRLRAVERLAAADELLIAARRIEEARASGHTAEADQSLGRLVALVGTPLVALLATATVDQVAEALQASGAVAATVAQTAAEIGGSMHALVVGAPPDTQFDTFGSATAVPLDRTDTAAFLAAAAGDIAPTVEVHLRRLSDRIEAAPAVDGADRAGELMACPDLGVPVAFALAEQRPDLLVPGLADLPMDRVTLLEENRPFAAALMAGANHEMNRELLWREYPTDRRGTPLRRFWPVDGHDVAPITDWAPNGPLGAGIGQGTPGRLVVLVRAAVLARYPGTIVRLAPATGPGQVNLDTNRWLAPDFALRLDPSTALYAFPLGADQAHSGPGRPGFYVMFREPATGTRFGLDLGPDAAPTTWSDLRWASVPMRGAHLDPAGVLPHPAPPGPAWNAHAADLARIMHQQPFQIGVHADELLPRPGPVA